MSDFASVFGGIVRRAEPVENPGDFRRDGLLYCGTCGVAKECRIDLEGVPLVVGCMCRCMELDYERERREIRERDRMMRVRDLRVQGISDREVRGYTFANSQDSEILRKCRTYVDRWDEMLARNAGLLFWGNVGGGKTHAAACIANALIDRGIPALVTSFLRILNSGWDKAELAGQMKEFPLLVLDDLGTERESDYAMEIVQLVVDERYKTGLPLIVTTNLSLTELENPKNMRYARIYDRVMELCVPVYFGGESRRKKKAEDNMRFAREVFA